MFVLLFLGTLAAAPSGPVAPLSVVAAPSTLVGLTDEEGAQLRQKLEDELAALNLTVFPGPAALDPACPEDAACLREQMTESGGEVWVTYEAIRVGPVVQLAVNLFSSSGGELVRSQGSVSATDFPAQATILTPPALAKLQEMLAARAPAPERAPEPRVEETAPPGQGLSPLQTTGIFVAGVGVAMAGIAGVVAASQIAVVEDRKSLGTAKQVAAPIAWVGLGCTALGVAAAGTGVGLIFMPAE